MSEKLTKGQKFAQSLVLFFGGGIVIVIILAVLAYIGFNAMGSSAEDYVGDSEIIAAELDDGVYYGTFRAFGVIETADVKFTVENGNLIYSEFITLMGTPGYGAPEKIKREFSDYGDLNIDAITGATVTTSFAGAAIKNATENGPQ